MMKLDEGFIMDNFEEYLTVKEAAKVLGVAILTLHRWDVSGKLKARRHPINHYRLYKKSELERLLKKAAQTGKKTT
jgi:excisionase family DNA binding protein